MKTATYLSNRLEEVLLNGKWVTGTNFKEQIENVHWEEAIRSVGELNSIAQITFHIHYYLQGVLRVFQGGSLDIHDKYSFDMPRIQSEKDWSNLKSRFLEDSKTFINVVNNMKETEFQSIFVEKKYGTFERSVDVIIEHSNYHLGQIVLLKKLLA